MMGDPDKFTYKAGDVQLIPLQCMFCKYYKGGKDGCSKLGEVPRPVWEKKTNCSEFKPE
jgi:hypothetical protein